MCVPPCIFAQLSEEDVNYSQPKDLTLYDYPPRIIFEIKPTANSEPCTLLLRLTGMTKDIKFRLPLKGTKHSVPETRGESQSSLVALTHVYKFNGSSDVADCMFYKP